MKENILTNNDNFFNFSCCDVIFHLQKVIVCTYIFLDEFLRDSRGHGHGYGYILVLILGLSAGKMWVVVENFLRQLSLSSALNHSIKFIISIS